MSANPALANGASGSVPLPTTVNNVVQPNGHHAVTPTTLTVNTNTVTTVPTALPTAVTNFFAAPPVVPPGASQMDLGATAQNIVLGSNLFNAQGSVTIDVGGSHKTFQAGASVTPAEFLAVQQVLQSGRQSIVLNGSGAATGGQFNVNQATAQSVSDLVIPVGVTGIQKLNTSNVAQIAGGLVNFGRLFDVSTNSGANTGIFLADSITNEAGALISTRLPASVRAEFPGALTNVNLVLAAINGITNLGTISSSGALTLATLNGSIDNGTGAVVCAYNDVNLFSSTVNNAGSIGSATGNINISSVLPTDITVNAAGGTFQALTGDINVSTLNNGNITLNGGNYLSQNLNLNAGTGDIEGVVDAMTGTLNSVAGIEHFAAATNVLTLGNNFITGDPTYVNTAGNIVINGTVGDSGDANLSIIASGNITSTASGKIDTTGNSGNVYMIAGANVALSGGATTTTTTDPPFQGATPSQLTGGTVNVTFTPGTGGNIDMSASPATAISTHGGSVNLLAFANGGTGGHVNVPSIDTSNTAAGASGGAVNIIAGANAAGAVTLGTIATGGGGGTNSSAASAGTGGAITIITANPKTVGGGGTGTISFDTTGTPSGTTIQTNPASYTTNSSAGVTATGDINTSGSGGVGGGNGVDGTAGGNAGAISISAGSVSTHNLLAFGGGGGGAGGGTCCSLPAPNGGQGGNAGSISVTARSITVTGQVNASGGGGGGGGGVNNDSCGGCNPAGTGGAGGLAAPISLTASAGSISVSGQVVSADGGAGGNGGISMGNGGGGGGGGASFGGGGGGGAGGCCDGGGGGGGAGYFGGGGSFTNAGGFGFDGTYGTAGSGGGFNGGGAGGVPEFGPGGPGAPGSALTGGNAGSSLYGEPVGAGGLTVGGIPQPGTGGGTYSPDHPGFNGGFVPGAGVAATATQNNDVTVTGSGTTVSIPQLLFGRTVQFFNGGSTTIGTAFGTKQISLDGLTSVTGSTVVLETPLLTNNGSITASTIAVDNSYGNLVFAGTGFYNFSGQMSASSVGSIDLTGLLTGLTFGAGNFLAVAGGSITSTNPGANTIITVPPVPGNAGTISLIAGTNYNFSLATPTSLTVTTASAQGGNIDFSGSGGVNLFSGNTTGNGGDINLIARDNGSGSFGRILFGTGTIGAWSSNPGSSGGNVTVIATGNPGSATTVIQLNSIVSGGSPGGNVLIATAPLSSGNVTFSNGAAPSGSFTASATPSLNAEVLVNGSINTSGHNGAGGVSVIGGGATNGGTGGNAGNISISAGAGITVGNVLAFGGGGGGGGGAADGCAGCEDGFIGAAGGQGGQGGAIALTTNSTGSVITVNGTVNSSGGGGGGGGGSGDAAFAGGGSGGFGGAAGTITLSSGGSIGVTGQVLAVDGGNGGNGGGSDYSGGGGGGGGASFGGGGGGGGGGNGYPCCGLTNGVGGGGGGGFFGGGGGGGGYNGIYSGLGSNGGAGGGFSGGGAGGFGNNSGSYNGAGGGAGFGGNGGTFGPAAGSGGANIGLPGGPGSNGPTYCCFNSNAAPGSFSPGFGGTAASPTQNNDVTITGSGVGTIAMPFVAGRNIQFINGGAVTIGTILGNASISFDANSGVSGTTIVLETPQLMNNGGITASSALVIDNSAGNVTAISGGGLLSVNTGGFFQLSANGNVPLNQLFDGFGNFLVGPGVNVLVVAGADVTANSLPAAGPINTNGANLSLIAGANYVLDLFSGNTTVNGAGNGGNIDLSNISSINTTSAGSGGNVALLAYANGANGGNINAPSIDTHSANAGSNGGGVTIIGGANDVNAISLGAITTVGGSGTNASAASAGTGGSVTIITANPQTNGGNPITFHPNGTTSGDTISTNPGSYSINSSAVANISGDINAAGAGGVGYGTGSNGTAGGNAGAIGIGAGSLNAGNLLAFGGGGGGGGAGYPSPGVGGDAGNGANITVLSNGSITVGSVDSAGGGGGGGSGYGYGGGAGGAGGAITLSSLAGTVQVNGYLASVNGGAGGSGAGSGEGGGGGASFGGGGGGGAGYYNSGGAGGGGYFGGGGGGQGGCCTAFAGSGGGAFGGGSAGYGCCGGGNTSGSFGQGGNGTSGAPGGAIGFPGGAITASPGSPISGGQDIFLTSANFAVSNPTAGHNITFTISGSFTNTSSIRATGSLTIDPAVFTNSGPMTAAGTINISGMTNQGPTTPVPAVPNFTNSGAITSTGGNINISSNPGQNLVVTGGGTLTSNTGSITLTATDNGSFSDLIFAGNQTFSTPGGATNLVANGIHQCVWVQSTATVTSANPINVFSACITLDGSLNGSPVNFFSPVSGATIVNTVGNVTLPNDLNFFGQNLAILSSGSILGTGVTTINVSNGAGTSGNLVMVAGYNFTPGTPGQVQNNTSYTMTTPSGSGGSISLPGVKILANSTGGGDGGEVVAVAYGGSVTLGNIDSSSVSGSAGDVGLYGNGITVGNITTSGLNRSGNVIIASGLVNPSVHVLGGGFFSNASDWSVSSVSTGANIIAGNINTSGVGAPQAPCCGAGLDGGSAGNITITGSGNATLGYLRAFGGGGSGGFQCCGAAVGGAGGNGGNVTISVAGTININGDINTSGGGGGGGAFEAAGGNGGNAGAITISTTGTGVTGAVSIAGPVLAAGGGGGSGTDPFLDCCGNGGGGSFGGGGSGGDGGAGGGGFLGGGGSSNNSSGGGGGGLGAGAAGGSGTVGLSGQGGNGFDCCSPFGTFRQGGNFGVSGDGSSGGPGFGNPTFVGQSGNGAGGAGGNGGVVSINGSSLTIANSIGTAGTAGVAGYTGTGITSSPFASDAINVSGNGGRVSIVTNSFNVAGSMTGGSVTISNTSGNLNLVSDVVAHGQNVAILSVGDIVGAGATRIDTSNTNGNAGAIAIVTGFNLSAPDTNGTVTVLTPSAGGSIILPGVNIDGSSNVNPGDSQGVLLVARGTVTTGSITTLSAFGNASGVTIRGNGINLGDGTFAINTTGDFNSGSVLVNSGDVSVTGGTVSFAGGAQSGSGNFSSSNFSGNIFFNGNVNSNIAAITVTTGGSGSITESAVSGLAGGPTTLTAGTGGIGTSSQPLSMFVGNVTANTTGSAYLSSFTSALTVSGSGDTFQVTDTDPGASITVNAISANNLVLTTAGNGSVNFNASNTGFTGPVTSNVTINTATLNVAPGVTISADPITITGTPGFDTTINNAGTITTTGNLTINSAAGFTLFVLGGGSMQSTGGTVSLTAVMNTPADATDIHFTGNQDFFGTTHLNATGVNQCVIIDPSATVTAHGVLTINSPCLDLNGTLSPDTTGTIVFNSGGAGGTIANSLGDVNLSGGFIFHGLDFTILAAGNVNASGPMTIDLSSTTGNGGNFTVFAGWDFTPATGGQVGPVSTTFTLGAPSSSGGSIHLGLVDVTTASTGGNGGNVTLLAHDGFSNIGSISIGNINTRSANGNGGNVSLMGLGGVSTGDITTTGANTAPVNIVAGTPTMTASIQVWNGVVNPQSNPNSGLPQLYNGFTIQDFFATPGSTSGNINVGNISAFGNTVTLITQGAGAITQTAGKTLTAFTVLAVSGTGGIGSATTPFAANVGFATLTAVDAQTSNTGDVYVTDAFPNNTLQASSVPGFVNTVATSYSNGGHDYSLAMTSSGGDIFIANGETVSATNNLTLSYINSGGILNNGSATLSAGNDLRLSTQFMTNNGVISAGHNFTVDGGGLIPASAQQVTFNNGASETAGNNVHIVAVNFDNHGTLTSNLGNILVDAQNSVVNHGFDTMQALNGDITINANNFTNRFGGLVSALGNLHINVFTATNNFNGTLNAGNGLLTPIGDGNINISANSFTNNGSVAAVGNINVNGGTLGSDIQPSFVVSNNGTMTAGIAGPGPVVGTIHISAFGFANNGTMSAIDTIAIDGGTSGGVPQAASLVTFNGGSTTAHTITVETGEADIQNGAGVSATNIAIDNSFGTLVLGGNGGNYNFTGQMSVTANSGGSIDLTGLLNGTTTGGGNFLAVSSGSITATNGSVGTISTNNGGDAGSITMVADAAFNFNIASPNTLTVTGASTKGGNIDFTGSAGVNLDASSTGGNGGAVTLISMDNGTSGTGRILWGLGGNIDLSSTNPGSSGGAFTAIATGNPAAAADVIQLNDVTTGGSTGGNVVITTAGLTNGNVVFTNGAAPAGSFTTGATGSANAQISVTGDINTSGAGGVGGNTSFILDGGTGGSAGSITMLAGSSISVSGDLNAYGGGGGGGACCFTAGNGGNGGNGGAISLTATTAGSTITADGAINSSGGGGGGGGAGGGIGGNGGFGAPITLTAGIVTVSGMVVAADGGNGGAGGGGGGGGGGGSFGGGGGGGAGFYYGGGGGGGAFGGGGGGGFNAGGGGGFNGGGAGAVDFIGGQNGTPGLGGNSNSSGIPNEGGSGGSGIGGAGGALGFGGTGGSNNDFGSAGLNGNNVPGFNGGAFTSSSNNDITITGSDVTIDNGATVFGRNIGLYVSDVSQIDGTVQATNLLTMAASILPGAVNPTSQVIINGNLLSNADINVAATNFDNHGVINATGTLTINGGFNGVNTLYATDVHFHHNHGAATVTAGNIDIKSTSVELHSTVTATGDINILSNGTVDSDGNGNTTAATIKITANHINNGGGKISATGDLTLTANVDLTNSNSGTLSGNDIIVVTPSLTNNATMTINGGYLMVSGLGDDGFNGTGSIGGESSITIAANGEFYVNPFLIQTTNGGGLHGVNVLIVSNTDITNGFATPTTFDTSNTAGDAGSITLMAGANFTLLGGDQVQVTGASAPGGKIHLSDSTLSFNASSSVGDGGNITMIAFAGSTSGTGTIDLVFNPGVAVAPTIRTDGVTGSGNVTIAAGGVNPAIEKLVNFVPVRGSAITTGDISTFSAGGDTGGHVLVWNVSKPMSNGPLTFELSSNTIPSVAPGGVLLNGSVVIGNVATNADASGGPVVGTGSIDVRTNGSVTTQTVNTHNLVLQATNGTLLLGQALVRVAETALVGGDGGTIALIGGGILLPTGNTQPLFLDASGSANGGSVTVQRNSSTLLVIGDNVAGDLKIAVNGGTGDAGSIDVTNGGDMFVAMKTIGTTGTGLLFNNGGGSGDGADITLLAGTLGTGKLTVVGNLDVHSTAGVGGSLDLESTSTIAFQVTNPASTNTNGVQGTLNVQGSAGNNGSLTIVNHKGTVLYTPAASNTTNLQHAANVTFTAGGSAGAVTIGRSIGDGTGDVSITVAGTGKITESGGAKIFANDLTLSAGTGAIGSAAGLLTSANIITVLGNSSAVAINNTGIANVQLDGANAGGTFTFKSAGNIDVTDTVFAPKSVTIASTATNGKITLDAQVKSNLPAGKSKGGTVTLTATGTGTITDDVNDSTVQAGTVTLNSKSGDFGALGEEVHVTTATLNANTTGNVFIQDDSTAAVPTVTLAKANSTKFVEVLADTNMVTKAALTKVTGAHFEVTGDGNLTITGAVGSATTTATGTITVQTDGVGNIGGAGKLTAHNINLSTDTGNIGTAKAAINVATVGTSTTATLDVNAGGGLANVKNTGTVVTALQGGSGTGTNFTLNTSANTTINDLSTGSGSITIIESKGTLTVGGTANTTVTANNGNMLLQSGGKIVIGDSTGAHSTLVNTTGNNKGTITISIGAPPKTPVAGPFPANVIVNPVGTGAIFFGTKGITVGGPGAIKARFDAINTNLIFNAGASAGNITVNDAQITADPPAPAPTVSMPVLNHASLVNQMMQGNQPSTPSLTPVQNDNVGANAGIVPASISASTMNATAAMLASVAGQSATRTAFVPGWISETELANGEIPAVVSSDEAINIKPSVSSVVDMQVGAAQTSGKMAAKNVSLNKGSVVFAPSVDTTVRTAYGDISIAAHSVVLVLSFSGGIAIYDMDDTRADAVVANAGGRTMSMRPGTSIVITDGKARTFDDVNPAQLILYRNVAAQKVGSSLKVFVGEFMPLSAIHAVTPLRQLVNSKQPEARRIGEHMLKTSAIVVQTRGAKGTYKQVLRPSIAAWNQ